MLTSMNDIVLPTRNVMSSIQGDSWVVPSDSPHISLRKKSQRSGEYRNGSVTASVDLLLRCSVLDMDSTD